MHFFSMHFYPHFTHLSTPTFVPRSPLLIEWDIKRSYLASFVSDLKPSNMHWYLEEASQKLHSI